jgi:hypothetical protein
MPYQNRVDPWGALHAVEERGSLLGNRGVIHDDNKNIVATHRLQGWVTCRLKFKNIQRQVMSPGTYTELFFLDEATAFSAGHRPCVYCQRQRYAAFKDAWLQANQHHLHHLEGRSQSISTIDKLVHKERIYHGKKVTYLAPFQSLPSGTIVDIAGHAYLVWDNRLYAWSFSGYQKAKDIPSLQPDDSVVVLTPQSYVNTFQTGFLPHVHDSINLNEVVVTC